MSEDFLLKKIYVGGDFMITGEFDEEILQDLINEGYEGSTLLEKFKEIRVIE